MDITTNHVVAAASAISALGIGLIYWQVRLAAKQFLADHERSRREKAIELMMHMDISRRRQGATARKFVERLSFDQARSLLNQESFSVDAKYKDLILGCLSGQSEADFGNERIKDEKITLTEKESADIRWQVVSYLNNLESVLSAWRHNVADREMIEEQYHFLVSPQEGHFIMKEFREAAGGARHFPAIEEFVEYLQTQNNNTKGKEKVA